MASSVNIFDVRIDDIGADEVRETFSRWLLGAVVHIVVTPNPEFLLLARRDEEFRAILNSADLSLPDGTGLRFAVSALTDTTLQHRVTGIDALQLLAATCAMHNKRLLLLGGQHGVSGKAALALRDAHHGLDVVALDIGRIHENGDLSPQIVDMIGHIAPDAIAVALGQGKQERCMMRYKEIWTTPRIFIGVGGACDTLAEVKQRAPSMFQRTGFEWLWRLVIEPRRWRRIVNAFPIFPAVVVFATLKQRRFWRAVRQTLPEIIRQVRGI